LLIVDTSNITVPHPPGNASGRRRSPCDRDPGRLLNGPVADTTDSPAGGAT